MLEKIRNIGIHPDLTTSDLKRIRLLNNLFVATITLSIFLFLWTIINKNFTVLYFFAALFFAESSQMLLIYKHHHKAAFHLVIFLYSLIFAVLKVFTADDIGIQFTFLLIIYLVYLLFDKKWRRILFTTIIVVIYLTAFYLNTLITVEYSISFPAHRYIKSIFFVFYVWLIYYLINFYHKEVVMERTKQEKLIHTLNLQNQKLAVATHEMERFSYIASHDLKSPIRNIIGFVGLIKHKINKNKYDVLPEKIAYINNASKQMNKLLVDIEIFSKISQSVELMETVDLKDVVKNVLTAFEEAIKSNNIQVLIHGDLPIIQANYEEIKIVFSNLIENGFQYNTSNQPTISITALQTNEHTIIEIQDNGIGIKSEYHATIFEYFKRLHNYETYPGSGLGLAVCKKIIQRMNGTITLKSELNQGATFIIQLPITNQS